MILPANGLPIPDAFSVSSGEPSTSLLQPDAKMQIKGQLCTGKGGEAQVKVHELLVWGKLCCVTLSCYGCPM